MEWKKELNNRYQNVLIGESFGINFEIILPSYGKSFMVFVDGTKAGCAVRTLEEAKKWCEDFEYCHSCGDHPIHSDKLCHDCYYK